MERKGEELPNTVEWSRSLLFLVKKWSIIPIWVN